MLPLESPLILLSSFWSDLTVLSIDVSMVLSSLNALLPWGSFRTALSPIFKLRTFLPTRLVASVLGKIVGPPGIAFNPRPLN